MRARGLYEIKRHYQSANHLRKDQRYRAKKNPEAVRRVDAQILYGDRLVAERMIYMDWEVPGLGHQQPFYNDVLEAKPFLFTSVLDRLRIQIQLLTTFVRGGGRAIVDVRRVVDPGGFFNWEICLNFRFQLRPKAYRRMSFCFTHKFVY